LFICKRWLYKNFSPILDVIQAYKSIIKEKEALEASLVALNETNTKRKPMNEESKIPDESNRNGNPEEPSPEVIIL